MRHSQGRCPKAGGCRIWLLPQKIKVTFVTLQDNAAPSHHNLSFIVPLSCLVQQNEPWHSFIHSFNKYQLNIYFIPGTVQTLEHILEDKGENNAPNISGHVILWFFHSNFSRTGMWTSLCISPKGKPHFSVKYLANNLHKSPTNNLVTKHH